MKNNKTILIVEDENTLLTALEKKFSSSGFTVITAQDGEQGLDIAQAKNPDLILRRSRVKNLDLSNHTSHLPWLHSTKIW